MLELARDAQRRAALGRAGRARVRNVFGLERMIEETLTVYRAVQQPRARGR
jgi:glycosyltransferase involved in cell wall biosynthesis